MQRYWSIFLFLLVLAPCFQWLRVWPLTSAMADGVALLTASLFGAWIMLRTQRARWVFSPLLTALGVFFLSMLASVVMNYYTEPAAWHSYFLYLLVLAVLLLAAAQVLVEIGRDAYVKRLALALWLGVVIYAVVSLLRYYGLLQWLGAAFFPTQGRMEGMWGQANLNTTTLWIGAVAAVYCCLGEGRRHWKRLGATLLLCGWGISASASRESWLLAAGLLLLAGVSSIKRFRASDGGLRSGLALSAIILLILGLLLPFANAPLNNWLTQQGLVHRATITELANRDALYDVQRLTEWRKTLNVIPQMSAKQLWLGVGPGRYTHFSNTHIHAVSLDVLRDAVWTHAHNLFLMVFVQQGLVGLLLLLVFVGWIGWRVLRRPIDRHVIFLIGVVGLIFVHSNFEYPLWFAWFLLLTGLLLLPLFSYRVVVGSNHAKPLLGWCWLIGVLALTVTLVSGYRVIVKVSEYKNPGAKTVLQLVNLRRNNLLGPYAVLMRYRHFEPPKDTLVAQIKEADDMEVWRPGSSVIIRQFMLYLLAHDYNHACGRARYIGLRYPLAVPYSMQRARIKQWLPDDKKASMQSCFVAGLKLRGKTLAEVNANWDKKMRVGHSALSSNWRTLRVQSQSAGQARK